MADENKTVIEVADTLSNVSASQWDACANPNDKVYDPFISYDFLQSLEKSEAVHPRTGWQPQHLLLKSEGGELKACMPLYCKSHSKGEYVSDYGWAEAFERAGGHYYPKLVSAVPFTPVPGRRLLVRPGLNCTQHEKLLMLGAIELMRRYDMSSLHINFLPAAQWNNSAKNGFLQRTDQQFHWQNQNYSTFNDFLSELASRKRKTMRKERSQALTEGIEIEWISGTDITEEHWDAIYMFYMDTGSRKWGHPYLNREFFSLLGATLADKCLLIMALKDGRYIAGALNMIGGDCLYGRYWGATEHHPCLHFEVCYYQAIDYAIQHGLNRVEAGAQGEHKLTRGYMPTPTYSAHYIAHPSFRRAIASYLENERAYIEKTREALSCYGPYRAAANETE